MQNAARINQDVCRLTECSSASRVPWQLAPAVECGETSAQQEPSPVCVPVTKIKLDALRCVYQVWTIPSATATKLPEQGYQVVVIRAHNGTVLGMQILCLVVGIA